MIYVVGKRSTKTKETKVERESTLYSLYVLKKSMMMRMMMPETQRFVVRIQNVLGNFFDSVSGFHARNDHRPALSLGIGRLRLSPRQVKANRLG